MIVGSRRRRRPSTSGRGNKKWKWKHAITSWKVARHISKSPANITSTCVFSRHLFKTPAKWLPRVGMSLYEHRPHRPRPPSLYCQLPVRNAKFNAFNLLFVIYNQTHGILFSIDTLLFLIFHLINFKHISYVAKTLSQYFLQKVGSCF